VSCTMCGTNAGCGGCPIAAGFYVATTLDTLRAGARGVVQKLAAANGADLRKLLALGLLPGVSVEVERCWPAMVVRAGSAVVALDGALAAAVIVAER
jgi:ferrous iron transport protein A